MFFYLSPYYLVFSAIAWVLFYFSRNLQVKQVVLSVLNLAVFAIIFSLSKKQALVFMILSAYALGTSKLLICIPKAKDTLRKSIICLTVFLIFLTVILSAIVPGFSTHLAKIFGRASTSEFICLSFFLIRMIHVLVDLYSGAIDEFSMIDLLNYFFFFPIFLSGPLYRFQKFSADFRQDLEVNWENSYRCFFRIARGYFKKFVLAGFLSFFSIDQIGSYDLSGLPWWKIVGSLYVFTFVLYLDFSGYTDIAIGLSELLGFHCPENFNKPLRVTNLQDFWNRWHISFIDWLKEYIFFPLYRLLYRSGLKNLTLVAMISTGVTFIFSGIWHGVDINYVYYGMYHASGLILLTFVRHLSRGKKLWPGLGWFVTFNYISFGWFFFLDKSPFR